MKTILIEQVANGWIVRNQDYSHVTSYKLDDIRVYRTVHELAEELPMILATEQRLPCPDPNVP